MVSFLGLFHVSEMEYSLLSRKLTYRPGLKKFPQIAVMKHALTEHILMVQYVLLASANVE